MSANPGIGTLAAALRGAGYTLPGVHAILRTVDHLSSRAEEVAVLERRAREDSGAALLVRLFMLNLEVDSASWERLLPDLAVRSLEDWGLADSVGKSLRARVRLVPHGDLYIVSDRADEGNSRVYVTGINNPAVLLADLTMRRPVALGLDLGCGGGIQALLLSRHCEKVIATDVNPHAIELTELNALLNGVTNIECRLGSLFEPVADLRFDRIVSNPPYVISPETTLLYRDSGKEPGALCRELVGSAAGHLTEGGVAQMLVSWAERAGEEWAGILTEWVGESPCDALFLHYSAQDPLEHAARWTRPQSLSEVAESTARLDAWVAYCAGLGIESIGFGSVTLRGREGPGWRRADKLRSGQGAAGEHLARVFAGEDFTRSHDSARDFFGARFRLAPGHLLEQSLTMSPAGGWEMVGTRLTMTVGLGFQGTVNPGLAQLLQYLNGGPTLGEAIARAARDLGLPESDMKPFRTETVGAVRRLVQLGFFEIVA